MSLDSGSYLTPVEYLYICLVSYKDIATEVFIRNIVEKRMITTSARYRSACESA